MDGYTCLFFCVKNRDPTGGFWPRLFPAAQRNASVTTKKEDKKSMRKSGNAKLVAAAMAAAMMLTACGGGGSFLRNDGSRR